MTHRVRSMLLAVIAACVFFGSFVSTVSASITHLENQSGGTNLIKNPEFNGNANDWILSNSTYNSSDNHPDSVGGSIKLGTFSSNGSVSQIITPTSGMYELVFSCLNLGSSPGKEIFYTIENASGYVVDAVTSIGVFSNVDLDCSSDSTWATYTRTVGLASGEAYTLTFTSSNAAVDHISLAKVEELIDIDTGLVRNGDLIGTDQWILSNTIELASNEGFIERGSLYIPPSAVATQVIDTPSETALYEFLYMCKSTTSEAFIKYEIIDSSGVIANSETDCDSDDWVSRVYTQTLVASETYTLRMSRSAISSQNFWIDDIIIRKAAALSDIDTGYIRNGDFIGSDEWIYENTAQYTAILGETAYGSARITKDTGEDQIVQLTDTLPESGQYDLEFNCSTFRVGPYGLAYLDVSLESPTETVDLGSFSCIPPFLDSGSWVTHTATANLSMTVPTAYTASFRIQNLFLEQTIYVDDIILTKPSDKFPDRMAHSCGTPLCVVASAIGNVTGIRTDTGSANVKSTAMSVPVAGENLAFDLNYASGRASQHASGYPAGNMGNGWVHNYDMRIVTDDNQTALSNSIELQTPEGNNLPFLDQGDGTYVAYSGVMASLIENLDGSFTVTGYNEMTYEFDNAGKLTSQTDSSGNTITFTYNSGGLLHRATQNDRYLEYGYDVVPLEPLLALDSKLIIVTDHEGRSISLAYDSNDNLSTVTNDSTSDTTTYSYADTSYPHHLTKVTDDTGKEVKEIRYDSSGRAYETLDGNDNVLVSIDYTNPNQPIVNNRGVTETHTYDSRGTLTGITYDCTGDPGCGEQISSGYDGQYKATDLQDTAGNPTSMVWSTNGFNLESVTNALSQTTSMQYDAFNNVTHITDARGNTITNTYTHPNLPRFLTSTTNELGQTTIFTPTYNTVQNSVTVPDGLLLAQEGPNGVVTQYEYDIYGQMIKQTVGFGTPSAIVTSYGYDALGRLQTVTDGNNVTSLTVYDGADRTIATIQNWTGSNPANWQTECVTTSGARSTNICTQYAYDGAGRLISTTDPLGRINLNFYDNASRMYLAVQNYDGTSYTNPEADLCDFVNPDDEHNLCSKTEYDSYGRVIITTDPLGRQTRTEYDSLGRVAGTIVNSVNVTALNSCSFDPARTNSDQDLCTVYTYDERGNVIVTQDPVGRQNRTFYDALNRSILTVQNWTGENNYATQVGLCSNANGTNKDENICSFTEYDEVGNVIITTDATGVQTRTFYDELNRVAATVRNWNSDVDPSQVGDPVITAADCVYGANNLNEENICSKVGYNPITGQQTTSTNALDQTALTVYDDLGRPFLTVANWDGVTVIDEAADCTFNPAAANSDTNLCSVTEYDSLGRRSKTINPKGFEIVYGYDDLGRVITTTRYLDGGTTPVISTSEYDALGNLLSSTNAENQTMSYQYDTLNRTTQTTSDEGVISTQTYNALGWMLTSSNNYNYTTINTYDELGRLKTTTDPENNVTTFIYDVLGNQTAKIDANLVKTTYGYDKLNRLASVLENDIGGPPTVDANVLTQYHYDVRGNQLHTTDARNIQQRITQYDKLNRREQVTDALNNVTTYSYDALGNLRSMTDGNSETTQYAYDGLNRQTTITYTADVETVAYTFDALSNVLTMSDGTGVTAYNYDDFSRPITITYPITGVVGYGYDKLGNRTSITYPDNKVVTYAYDTDSRLITVTDWDSQVTSYGYDDIGRLITTTLPNGVTTVNSYDNSNRLTALSHTTITGTVGSFDYQLDGVGNRIVVTETLTTGGVITSTTGSSCGDLVQEAEDGTITGTSLVVGNDGSASGGQFIHIPDGNGSNWSFSDSNKISYCFTVTETGTYQLKGWVDAPNYESNSFFVRTSISPTTTYYWNITPINQGFITDYVADLTTNTDPISLQLTPGDYIIDVSPREDGTKLDKLELQLMSGCDGLVQEAESGIIIGNDLEIGTDASASGGAFIHLPEGNGSNWSFSDSNKVTYCFTVPEAGTYQLKGWGDSPSYTSNSLFVRTSLAPSTTYLWHTYPVGQGFGIDYTSDATTSADPVVLSLTPGNLTVEISPREDGTKLDKLHLELITTSSSGPATVTGFTLIDAENDVPVAGHDSLVDGATVNLAHTANNTFNIRAHVTGAVGSVGFGGSFSGTENTSPFALFGQSGGDYSSQTFTTGTYTVTATPYSGSNGTGTAGTPVTIAFTVIDDPNVPPPGGGTTTTGSQTTVIQYEYDDLYRLTEADYTGALTMTYQYEYDAVGNMEVVTETNGIDTTIEIRDFNNGNQLITSTLGTEVTTFLYDGNGNMKRTSTGANPQIPDAEQLYSYLYDQRNLLTAVNYSGGDTSRNIADYIYDGNGNRVQQLTYEYTGLDTYYTHIDTYINDASGLTQELLTESETVNTFGVAPPPSTGPQIISPAQASYTVFGIDLISVEDMGQDTYILGDALGSGRVELLEDNWLSTTTYEPFGNLVARTGEKGTIYGFTGEQEDDATGLVYLRARYYNPRWRIFMSVDPFDGWQREPASQHPYSYVHNNPIMHTDPSGNCVEPITGLACATAALYWLGATVVTYVSIQWIDWVWSDEGQASIAQCLNAWDNMVESVSPSIATEVIPATDRTGDLLAQEFFKKVTPEPRTTHVPVPLRVTVTPTPQVPTVTPTNEASRHAILIGAGSPGSGDNEEWKQVDHLAKAYNNRVIVNEIMSGSAFLWQYHYPGLMGYHDGPAQTLGLQDNADIFAIAPNYGQSFNGILSEIADISTSLIGVNTDMYLAIDGGQYDWNDLSKLQRRGFQVSHLDSWYNGTTSYGPIIVRSKPVTLTSVFFLNNSKEDNPNHLVKISK